MNEARFWRSVLIDDPDRCWTWTARKNAKGYGQFRPDGRKTDRQLLAHRIAYELLVGEIPEGLTLDHLCRNPACVNPRHLEPVTRGENVLRGIGPTAINARKTHCKRGHPLSGSNLHVNTVGGRVCRTCARDRARKVYYEGSAAI